MVSIMWLSPGDDHHGQEYGIDPSTGFYNYELRPDAKINEVADYRNMQNYLFYVGTSTAPWTGGFNTSVRTRGLRSV